MRLTLPATVTGDAQGIYVGDLVLIWQKGKHGGTAHLPRDEKDLVYPGPLCDSAGAYEVVDFVGQRSIKVCSRCRRIREGGAR